MRLEERYEELAGTLHELAQRGDYDATINTLNIIANLLWETGEKRNTAAVYTRTLKHGKLTITVDYRE